MGRKPWSHDPLPVQDRCTAAADLWSEYVRIRKEGSENFMKGSKILDFPTSVVGWGLHLTGSFPKRKKNEDQFAKEGFKKSFFPWHETLTRRTPAPKARHFDGGTNNSSLGQFPRGKYDSSAWYFSLGRCERLFYTSNPDMIQDNFKRMVLFFLFGFPGVIILFLFSMEKNMLAYATCHLLNAV